MPERPESSIGPKFNSPEGRKIDLTVRRMYPKSTRLYPELVRKLELEDFRSDKPIPGVTRVIDIRPQDPEAIKHLEEKVVHNTLEEAAQEKDGDISGLSDSEQLDALGFALEQLREERINPLEDALRRTMKPERIQELREKIEEEQNRPEYTGLVSAVEDRWQKVRDQITQAAAQDSRPHLEVVRDTHDPHLDKNLKSLPREEDDLSDAVNRRLEELQRALRQETQPEEVNRRAAALVNSAVRWSDAASSERWVAALRQIGIDEEDIADAYNRKMGLTPKEHIDPQLGLAIPPQKLDLLSILAPNHPSAPVYRWDQGTQSIQRVPREVLDQERDVRGPKRGGPGAMRYDQHADVPGEEYWEPEIPESKSHANGSTYEVDEEQADPVILEGFVQAALAESLRKRNHGPSEEVEYGGVPQEHIEHFKELVYGRQEPVATHAMEEDPEPQVFVEDTIDAARKSEPKVQEPKTIEFTK